MLNGYIDKNTYERLVFEEGDYYPLIFDKSDGETYCIYFPISDNDDEFFIGEADSFEEAYQIAQKYLERYRRKNKSFPKHVNPYNIQIDESEFLVMVKYLS